MSSLPSEHSRPVWLPYAYALLGCIILSWYVAYNGWPVVYDDTPSYLSRPAKVFGSLGISSEWNPLPELQGAPASSGSATVPPEIQGLEDNPVWFGGRSVYYGTVMVLVSLLATTYAIAVVQACICALAIAIPWFRLGFGPISYLAVLAILSALTGVAVMAAALTPDIFAAIAILVCASLLVVWRQLTRLDRAVLTSILCFAVLSHNSILALVLALSIACGMALAFGRMRSDYARFVPIWAASLVGLAGMLLFSLAAELVSGRPPLDFPHLSAKVATTEEGRMVLSEHCPELQLAVCQYQPQLKDSDWIAFMFSSDEENGVFAPAPLEMKYALAEEQVYVLYLVARERPIMFASRQIGDVLGMLTSFSLKDFDVSAKPNLSRILGREVMAQVRDTRAYRDQGRSLQLISLLMQGTVLASGVLALAFLALRWSRQPPTRAESFALFLLFGVVANAVICATLAGVFDRFQARVVWLVPLATAVAILQLQQRQNRREAAV